jgi:hypothetical protein
MNNDNKLLIFTGSKLRNPYKCDVNDRIQLVGYTAWNTGQLSILNQCVEVDVKWFDKVYSFNKYQNMSDEFIRGYTTCIDEIKQFLESEIKKQEGKDGQ